MANIVCNNEQGGLVMVFNDKDRKLLKSTLGEDCLKYILDTFGEPLDTKEPEKKSAKDLAAKYSEPMICRYGTDEYHELESLVGDDWEEFLDELGKYGLSCRFNNEFDCFTIG